VHIQGTFSARLGNMQLHFGNVHCTFREHSVKPTSSSCPASRPDEVASHIQGTFSARSGKMRRTFRERSAHIQGTFSKTYTFFLSGFLPRRGTFLHVQGTCGAHSGNVQRTFRERSVQPTSCPAFCLGEVASCGARCRARWPRRSHWCRWHCRCLSSPCAPPPPPPRRPPRAAPTRPLPPRPPSAHSGNVQCTFRECAVHIHGNVQCTFCPS
jgi:hypothetical protein